MKKIKEIFKRSKKSTIASIVTFFLFWAIYASTMGMYFDQKIKFIILGIIPFLLFLTVAILININYKKIWVQKFISKFNSKNIVRILCEILTVVLIFVLVEYYMILFLFMADSEIENPEKDIRYYSRFMNKELLRVFPSEIPSSVENIKFISHPGLLQAGSTIELSYVDNKMTASEFDSIYRKKATWVGFIDEYEENDGLFSTEMFYRFRNENNFKIYLIDGKCDNSGYCNHGKRLLAAYNETTKGVIFQHSEW